jgi:TRAP-type mannitol/chloroaromatic compound transport system substrate-binding protein
MKSTRSNKGNTTRRKFLLAGAAGAGAIAMPQVSRAQTATLKMQTSWPATDIFTEMAQQYVERVNAMAGGRLKIDLLHGGAVVHPFQVLDGVHGGQIDMAHTVTVYWYGKHKAASLFGTGPVFGFNANEGLGWIYNGGGKELFDELQTQIMKINVKSFFAMPMPTQPLGWFKNPVKDAAGLRGLKYRTVGLAADLFQSLGVAVAQLPGGEIVPAMERGVIDAFEFNNPTSDRRFGSPNVAKNYMLGSHHQATEYFEIMITRTKFDAQIKAWDGIIQTLGSDPFMKKVMESQKAWVKRVVFYNMMNATDYKGAYNHHFPNTLKL